MLGPNVKTFRYVNPQKLVTISIGLLVHKLVSELPRETGSQELTLLMAETSCSRNSDQTNT